MQTTKNRFYATPSNKMGEHYDEQNTLSKAKGRHMRWNAYIASVFGNCGRLPEYLRTGIMPEREAYSWAADMM